MAFNRIEYNRRYYLKHRKKALAYIKKYYRKNREKIKADERRRNILFKEEKNAYRDTMNGRISRWKKAARERNKNWGLTKEFIQSLPLVCAYTGIDLTCKSHQPNTVSLDRIDSTKGYTEDNVVLCCWTANMMKNSSTVSEFVDWCKKVADYSTPRYVDIGDCRNIERELLAACRN